jgi:two-component system cell cycle sensor histidine kinase/response regulator CckA
MATAANPNGRLVLVVDDEPMALRVATAALANAGFRVIVAENGAAGLEAFFANQDHIDLVLADIVMPVMDGTTMAERMKRVRPQTPILLMTAYSDVVIDMLNETKFPLIRKPFLPADLIRAVNANLDPPNAGAS